MTAPSALLVDPTRVEGRRIAAWTIDLLIFLSLAFGVLMATGGVDIDTKQFATTQEAIDYCKGIDQDGGRRACSPYQDEAVIVWVKGSFDGVWLANAVFYVLLQGLTGGSVGKLLLGLRVVDVDGNRCGVWKSFTRTFLWIVDGITCGLPAVGGTLMVTRPGHQRFGDRAAGTFVVRKEAMGSPIVIPPPVATPPAPYTFQIPPPGYAPPPGYGPPPEGSAPPLPPMYPPPPPVPTKPAVEAPDTDGPHWDDDRDTYIQYDRGAEMWVEWDEKNEFWKPIDT